MGKEHGRTARGSFAISAKTFGKLKLLASADSKTFNELLNEVLDKYVEDNRRYIELIERQNEERENLKKEMGGGEVKPKKKRGRKKKSEKVTNNNENTSTMGGDEHEN